MNLVLLNTPGIRYYRNWKKYDIWNFEPTYREEVFRNTYKLNPGYTLAIL